MAGTTVISITYGLDVQEENDPYTHIAEEANRSVTEAGVPGAFLVDSFPVLKYVPEWVPGAGFKRKAREWKELATAMLESPFRAAMDRIVSPGSNCCTSREGLISILFCSRKAAITCHRLWRTVIPILLRRRKISLSMNISSSLRQQRCTQPDQIR